MLLPSPTPSAIQEELASMILNLLHTAFNPKSESKLKLQLLAVDIGSLYEG